MRNHVVTRKLLPLLAFSSPPANPYASVRRQRGHASDASRAGGAHRPTCDSTRSRVVGRKLSGNTQIPPGPECWGYHLRRLMPSTRRLITLGGAAFVGLAATAILAAPASAHEAVVSGSAVCANDG